MSGIYGRVIEHPEYPMTDDRRFTVQIILHKFEEADDRFGLTPRCTHCGFIEDMDFHKNIPAEVN